MSSSAAVFVLLETFAGKLGEKLLVNYLATEIADLRKRRRVESARRRVVDGLLDTLHPLIGTEITEDQAKLLFNQLTAAIDAAQLGPQLLAEQAYDPDRVLARCVAIHPPSAELRAYQLTPLYESLLRQAIVQLAALAPMLPDWERANWEQSFARLERIEQTQKQHSDLLQELKEGPDRQSRTIEEHYCRYVEATYGKIEMRGIRGVAEILSLPLNVLYVPLRLTPLAGAKPPDGDETRATVELADLDSARRALDASAPSEGQAIDDLLADSLRLVIVGEPGAGKSTLVQYIAWKAARRELRLKDDPVPFVFTVRSLDFDDMPTPRGFMAYCARQLDTERSATFVEEVLRSGRALILLDGLDECQAPPLEEINRRRSPAEETQWDKVLNWLEEFLKAHGDQGNRVVVTSRPAGYTRGLLGDREHGFAEAAIMPLGERDREVFVRNWCRAAERSAGTGESTAADHRAQEQADDLLGRIARTPSIRLLAGTPLMLSVLSIIHRYRGQQLPERRVELLSEYVDVLLYEWRKAQGLQASVIGDLDAVRQRMLLQPLALRMLEDGKAEFPRERVEEVFRKHLPEIQQTPERAPEILATIRDRTGVLIERRPGVFAFSHLVLQEYLAAEEAVRGGLDPLLTHADDPGWQEVIPLAAGVAKTSQETFIRSLLHKGHILLSGRCASAAERVDEGVRKEVVQALVEKLPQEAVQRGLLEIGGKMVAEACAKQLRVTTCVCDHGQGWIPVATTGTFETVRSPQGYAEWAEVTLHSLVRHPALLDLGWPFLSPPALILPGGETSFQSAGSVRVTVSLHLYGYLALSIGRVLAGLGEVARALIEEWLSEGDLSTPNRLFGLFIIAESMRETDAEWFFAQTALIRNGDFPFMRFMLLVRVYDRIGSKLGRAPKRRLVGLLQAEYREAGNHHLRFARDVDAELRKRGKPGITDDWEAYDAEFMRVYVAGLDKRKPPGWKPTGGQAAPADAVSS
ncbi:MAG: NACHT domain-containing protein [Planctomycetota bacterium]